MQLGRRRRIGQIEGQHTIGGDCHRKIIPAALRLVRPFYLLGRHRTTVCGNAHQIAAVAIPEIDLIEQSAALHESCTIGIRPDRPAGDIRTTAD